MRTLLLLLLACGPKDPDGNPDGSGPAGEAPVAAAGEPVFTFVGDTVSLDGAGSEGIQFRWDFGDGDSVGGASPEVVHSWQRPGHFTAVLQVTGSDGSITTDAVAVTATYRPDPSPPTASSALAALDGSLIAVLPDHDQLARVDRETGTVARITTCDEPRSVATAPDRVAVACTGDEVRIYDGSLTQVVALPMPRASRPFGVVYDSAGDLWVTLQGAGELAQVDEEGVVGTIPLGPDLRGLASTPEGLLVSRHRSSEAHGELWRVNPTVTASWTLARDPGPDSDTDARGLPTYLERIAVRPDARVAVVGGLKANTERGYALDGLPLTHESTTRAVLRQVALRASEGPVGSELLEPHFDDRDRVSAMAYHPRGDWLFAAHHGARIVDIVDSYTMERVGAFFDVGHGPDGLWVDGEAQVLWVLASLSRELVAYDLSDLFGPQTELARIPLANTEALAPEVLLGKQVFHDASDPRMTATGYISCASCHLDGSHDARTWDFTDREEGLRNTKSLLGPGGMGHGPLHWSANFDEVQDFEGDIRGPQAGQGFLADAHWYATSDPMGAPKAGLSEELDALAAYLSTLVEVPPSPHRSPDGSLTGRAATGEAMFNSPATGCAECHPPPTYTDSALVNGEPVLHDVGTLGPLSGERLGEPLTGLDTPSLRGLHAHAPYLHDGRHDTVRELLEDNPGDLHGVTSHLDSNDLDALEAFLLSIE